eukprot:CAMPEP_0174385360 /NCGR_PEP_ID=MMETSP0811_2-20130205/126551_1 /TAXON_ID=73025 ORGANISM="Eutreptiella gymnastica-like, Strain CCMP1594" /NCGR_SAMPLE_ID=MMETSP0811_2 /ASSEMBLY_ACC=CAM_ASM_000667 /LENGTH=180 /DNA_ID=CAMNT_0015539657 /DNA_START=142 /DNA_END=688 /DNA_ORIENTATION=-
MYLNKPVLPHGAQPKSNHRAQNAALPATACTQMDPPQRAFVVCGKGHGAVTKPAILILADQWSCKSCVPTAPASPKGQCRGGIHAATPRVELLPPDQVGDEDGLGRGDGLTSTGRPVSLCSTVLALGAQQWALGDAIPSTTYHCTAPQPAQPPAAAPHWLCRSTGNPTECTSAVGEALLA